MSTYTMRAREGTETFHRIFHKRKWVGRVVQHATDGYWLGIIGKTTVRRQTPNQAFDDVVATHLGYSSGAELRARNAAARRVKQMANRAGDLAISEMERGNFQPLEKMLEHPVGASAVLRAFTRTLRRDMPRKRKSKRG